MIISATSLIAGGVGTGATSYTTASISPIANQLILLAVQSEGNGNTNTPTITGAGMTWTQVAQNANSTQGMITLFRALSASPGAGVLTIDFAGGNQYNCMWTVDQFQGIDVSGVNGANAIIQSALASLTSVPNSTGITVTLGAFSNINNATYGVVVPKAVGSFTEGGSFTRLSNFQVGGDGAMGTEWANNNQTSVNWTWSSTETPVRAIAIEIKAIQASALVMGAGL